ncbi:hypothetical protein PV390_22270 [Streptomyces sp. ME02-6991-2A]|uniref:hypothetical protein n=1 Tax=Streptomyces sp. ME02-6991-2A TaxID=3028677 RepID=UPI0029A20C27|nr:hypothetical protein [Streptomyces sp. ME02-6991-2A]MDX3377124.1 hypothetical protein [Streptomyces sp. ME02-6991-2A]
MSTAGAADRTRPAWKVWAVVAVVVVVVAGLLHAWRNTNVLTGDRLCGGLVSASQADAVLPGSGRLDAEGDGLDDDLTGTVCRVGKSSVLLGSGDSELTVRVWAEQGDGLLGVEHLLDLPMTSFFSGVVTGGVDRRQAWVLLPEKCWTEKQPVIVRVSTTGPITDRAAFAALTTETARSVAAAAHCGDVPEKPGPLAPPVSDEARPVSEGAVCGLDGFSVRGQVPKGAKVLEAGQKAPAGLWSCSLYLDDDSSGIVRADGFMTYTVSRDPLFTAAVRKALGTTRGKAPDGRAAEVVNTEKMILPCAQGDPLYLAMRPRMQYLEAREPAGLPVSGTYFAAFTKAAAKTFGCAAPAAG